MGQDQGLPRPELTPGSLPVHGHVPVGQSSEQGAAQVREAEDGPPTRGQQEQQVLDHCVHAAEHLDAAETEHLWFGAEEDLPTSPGLQYQDRLLTVLFWNLRFPGNKVTLKSEFEMFEGI